MHRALRTLGFTLFGLVTLAGVAPAKSFHINPQAGVTATHLTSDPADITDQARIGYALGGNLRLGGMVYLSPGVYYQRTALELSARDTLTATTVKDVVGVNSLYLPLKLGASLSGIRFYGGPALTIVTSVAANDFGVVKDDYESSHTGFEAGVGFDLAVITIDLSYEKGLGKVFKNDDAKQDVLRAMVGIKI